MTPQQARQAISDLIALVGHSDVADLELSDGDLRVRLHRPKARGGGAAAGLPASEEGYAAQNENPPPRLVRSVSVGRFHSSRKRGGEPLVREGDTVDVGQALGVVEALNTFSDVVSVEAGRVARVLIAEGDRVEYGQPLVELE